LFWVAIESSECFLYVFEVGQSVDAVFVVWWGQWRQMDVVGGRLFASEILKRARRRYEYWASAVRE
jgi:hypothetical protein